MGVQDDMRALDAAADAGTLRIPAQVAAAAEPDDNTSTPETDPALHGGAVVNADDATPAPKFSPAPAPADAADLDLATMESRGKPKARRVYAAKLGGYIYVRATPAVAREQIEKTALRIHGKDKDVDHSRIKLDTVQAGWVNASGVPLYAGPAGRERLGAYDYRVTDEVFALIQYVEDETGTGGPN